MHLAMLVFCRDTLQSTLVSLRVSSVRIGVIANRHLLEQRHLNGIKFGSVNHVSCRESPTTNIRGGGLGRFLASLGNVSTGISTACIN